MVNMEDLCLRKPSKSKKHAREEKKKPKKETPIPEPETVIVADPVMPKVRQTPRKRDAKKSKGIIILEGQVTPEPKEVPSFSVYDKGKGALHEPSPPLKKQKLNPPTEPV